MTNRTRRWMGASALSRLRFLSAACISCCIFSALKSVDCACAGEEKTSVDPTSDAAAKKLREERLEYMRQSIGSTKVYRLIGGKRIPLPCPEEPLLRFSGYRNPILDATLWAWGGKGRPAALEKIELFRKARWQHCFASLSDDLVQAEWPDGHRWSSQKPGVELRALPNGPSPSDTNVLRLVQMKDIAGRFSSTATDAWVRSLKRQQRMLSRPVHRYSDPDSALLDGALFAFCDAGTNPNLLVLVELHGEQLPVSVWKYGFARMTIRGLDVRLDDQEVWSVPVIVPEKTFDTWLYFDESRRADSVRSRSP